MTCSTLKTFLRSTLAVSVLIAAAGPALAQNAVPPPNDFSAVDDNGVDMTDGTISIVHGTVSIGQPDQGGLSNTITEVRGATSLYRHSLVGGMKRDYSQGSAVRTYILTFEGKAYRFSRLSNGNYTRRWGGDGSLSPTLLFTAADGTTAQFSTSVVNWNDDSLSNYASLMWVQRPNGERLTYHYSASFGELMSVTNNRGYQIRFEGGGVRAINNAVDACAPTAASCTYSRTWPSLTLVGGGGYQDAAGRQTARSPSGKVWAGGGPAITTQPIIWDYYSLNPSQYDHVVSTVSDGVGSWSYEFNPPPYDGGNNPLPTYNRRFDVSGATRYDVAWSEANVVRDPYYDAPQYRRLVTQVTNPAGQATQYGFAQQGRLTQVIHPEGNRENWTYTTQGALQSWTHTPKAGSGLSPVSVTAAFADCSTAILCGLPTSVTDQRGFVTDFTYDAAGNLLTETAPAATVGAVRPQTRHAYAQRYAWFKANGSAAITQAATPVWVRTETSACTTSASCNGLAEEVQTTTAYHAGSASVGSNVLPISVTSGSGDGVLAATTTTSYDPNGDPYTVDGPLAGTADVTRYVHDAARTPVGVIGPDPDGSGSRLFPAVKTTYNADGQPTVVARGTTTGQTDAAFAAFSALHTDTSAYVGGLKVQDTVAAGTADAMVTQYGYDTASRPVCTTQRMNPANFGALPGACSLGTQGSHGPDRITHLTYDAAGRVAETRTGYATTDVRLDSKRSYTPNGQVDWAEDGNGNRSDYTYDGFDRLTRLNFPSATVGAHAADPNLYEQYGYDAADNPTTKRTRAGEWFTTTFDALNRITFVDAPAPATTDTAFTYDLLGRRLTATQPGVQTITSAWDALGRNTTESSSLGTLTNVYDLAGRRTYRYWPNGNWVRYTWDLSNQLTQVGVNDWLTAGAMTYDNLGRRTGISRYNGVTTSYGYDAASRLTSLTHDLAGTVNDVTYGLSYIPSGQIGQQTVSNSAYDWAPSVASTSYANNGLNQTTSAGGTPVSWESRGNLTSDGVRSYTYDAANRLLSGGGMGLGYDPLDRLYQHTGTAGGRFQYDGSQLAGVYDGAGTMVEHWVGGAGPDEWLALHAGGWLWPLQDWQSSVVALTDGSGVATAINAYDEYGQPKPGNAGRMQYTGQMMLPDLGLQHYKARAYHAGLGRFVQTDPVGYEQGMNLYAYVGNDPVNAVDPTGMIECPSGTREAGTCIDSRNYDPSKDGEKNATGTNASDAAAVRDLPSLWVSVGENYAYSMSGNSFVQAEGEGRATIDDGFIGEFEVPRNASMIAHSHPIYGANSSLVPSLEDSGSLSRGRPNYIVRQEEDGVTRIVVLERSQGQVQVRSLTGALPVQLRSQIQRRVDQIQRRTR